jgi:hypothetical protein
MSTQKKTNSAKKQAQKHGAKIRDPGLRAQYDSLMDPLTHEDEALLAYAVTVSDPWIEDPSGVPISLGFNATRTLKPQLKFEVQAKCNSSGFACVALAMDGWGQDPTNNDKYASYNGGTPGTPIWFTDDNYVGITVPVQGDTSARVGLNSVSLGDLDPQVTAGTNYRQVACGLKAYSEAAADTAQGKMMVISTSKHFGPPGSGAITGGTYANLYGLPSDLASVQTEPCAGWRSGHKLHSFAVPSDPDCFKFDQPPAIGNTYFGWPQLCVMVNGGAAGQTFTVEIFYDYEFTIGNTKITGVDVNPSVTVDGGRITNVLSNMQVLRPIGGLRPSRPGTMLTLGNGAHAAIAELAKHKPHAIASLMKRPSSSFVSSAVSAGVNFVKNNKPLFKGLVSQIPYVGKFISSFF